MTVQPLVVGHDQTAGPGLQPTVEELHEAAREKAVMFMFVFWPRAGKKRAKAAQALGGKQPLQSHLDVDLQDAHVVELQLGKAAERAPNGAPVQLEPDEVLGGARRGLTAEVLPVAEADLQGQRPGARIASLPAAGPLELPPEQKRSQRFIFPS